ncbi:acyl-CoA oxidase [Coccomyxa subellipsoidea C-169]|uniref:Acyl-coenzyme A oxidase n=1 Tax=Coccomyxa subellipsoidea (strain C-169) TaxID=574566 RepID=I0Z862_COCSC|nr:acyl-CoA oxidase [Coccomyxa subellipsoidea C-169]EIE26831.1 acyl-CoA oxidase [Coccomyxa subellipsoidea C-169]|eukprot:XP_005651375.1 acyl-CoA oxidase [Coccomyxa subellipsoidea C-169]
MITERNRASFDTKGLAEYLNGGKEKLQRLGELADLLHQQDWGNKSQRYYQNRQDTYESALKAALGIWKKVITMEDAMEARKLVDFPGGLELHIGMFIPTLLSQASPDQQAEWLPKALGLKLIGTYAQTELGHGTFVRGLQTNATYDPQSQEFVIHTPTLTATKWWPGGLGKTSTHVVAMARLFIKGKDYGPHSFVVPIRDMATHLPLPGIKVGDIGPKFGYNGVDNGYLSFNHVRVPLDNMLMRFSKVTPEGKYVPPPPSNQKASYATMVYVRATIVEGAGWALARSVTIAVRYAAVRRQTAAHAGELEVQVLDYQNTAADLLPLLASSYALIFMGKAGMAMYSEFEADRDRGNFDKLPELHAVLSGMKAVSTTIASDGMEAARRACGGHGYSLLSGLPTTFTHYVQNVTWEGDNNVMLLQTARYLVKQLLAARAGKAGGVGSADYTNNAEAELRQRCPVASSRDWLDPAVQSAAFRHRSARLCVAATDLLASASGGQVAFEGQAWNGNTVDLIRLSRAHCFFVLHSTFADSVQRLSDEGTLPAPTIAALSKLVSLFALSTLSREAGDFLEDGYMTGQQVEWARRQYYGVLRALRPDAVGLADAFGLSDYLLNSALGRADGDVYRALLAAAQASPLNETEEGPAWHSVLKPRLTPRARL